MEIIVIIILAFIIGSFTSLLFIDKKVIKNVNSLKNHVHFYVARDRNGELLLYMGKPFRGIDRFHPCQNGCIITNEDNFSNFRLNKDDYNSLKWEDEPIEVFINIED